MEKRELELLKTSIFKIDLTENKVVETVLTSIGTDFYNYIRGSIIEVSVGPGGRKFKLRSNSTEVVAKVLSAVSELGQPFDSVIASRLLREEVSVQGKIARMGRELNEGLLIVSIIEEKERRKAIICKVEDLQFIDKVNLKLNSGYPIKRKIFRSVQFVFNDKDEIVDAIVHDLNSRGATYWWDDFLELDQLWDDSYNTKTAFNIIDTKVLQKLKKDAPSDHTYLRNATIRYFRTNQEFTIEKFIEHCLDNYEPYTPSAVDVELLKATVRALPEKYSFDERFDLKPSEITAKIKYSIKLTEDIDLVIKDEIDIENTITPEKIHNRKYIRIRSDAGFDAFNKNRN